MNFTQELQQALDALRAQGNLRRLPRLEHDGRYVTTPDDGRRMLNLSSNDYLGLAADTDLRREFLETLTPETFLPTSSSSRLLTGNFRVYDELEDELARRFGTEAALPHRRHPPRRARPLHPLPPQRPGAAGAARQRI